MTSRGAATARFCPACGQPPGGGADQRRVVAVLFAHLVDSTTTAMGVPALVRRLDRHEGDGR